mmetsp:Transcript_28321/g.47574  ORF Transcript_28321/g.47574 Transcript_28321/m.47574 type:complete len:296 (+) Transcript_28321:5127-6014(+)
MTLTTAMARDDTTVTLKTTADNTRRVGLVGTRGSIIMTGEGAMMVVGEEEEDEEERQLRLAIERSLQDVPHDTDQDHYGQGAGAGAGGVVDAHSLLSPKRRRITAGGQISLDSPPTTTTSAATHSRRITASSSMSSLSKIFNTQSDDMEGILLPHDSEITSQSQSQECVVIGNISNGGAGTGAGAWSESETSYVGAGPWVEMGAETTYCLHSIVRHVGSSVGTGHYVSDVRDFESNKWMSMDDSIVREISQEAALNEERQRNGYIFVYLNAQCKGDMSIKPSTSSASGPASITLR